jgi:tetratricopeptide (TPR) repeat protein
MLRSILFRLVLIVAVLWLQGSQVSLAATTLPAEVIDPIQEVEALFQQAFSDTNAGDFLKAEVDWTTIIDRYPDNAAAWSNRGNAKVSQNKLEAAIADFDQAVQLAPNSPDPYLNRGTALEGLGQWQAAIADYNQVLKLNPQDQAGYNNRGNAKAGIEEWDAALSDYQQAMTLDPKYATARINYALTLYQVGQAEESIRLLRNLVRKYPRFVDARAALTAALWVQGKQGEAESQWVSVASLDNRYKDLKWVVKIRRWPPAIATALEKFLTLQDVSVRTNET